MVSVLCIGDPHIKVNNMVDSEMMIERLEMLVKERKPDFVVCMGDVLDRHSNIHVSCLMMAEKMVDKLSQLCPFFLLIGNHDRPNNSNFLTNEHPFNSLKKWNNVYVVDTFFKWEVGGLKFLFLPYVAPQRLDEAINLALKADNGENEKLEEYTTIFCHQEFKGAKMGGIVSEGGDKWDEKNPLVISGHIHDYDLLQHNIVYVGTPFQHTYSESIHKCVSMFTFKSSQSVNTEGSDTQNFAWEQERIDLGLKKKVTIYITPNEVHGYTPPQDKDVKLVIKGDEASIKTIAKVAKIQELKKMGVKVVFKAVQTIDTSKGKVVPKMSYVDRLRMEISSHAQLLDWYNKILQI